MFVGMSWGTPGWQSHWSLNSPKWSTPCMLKLEIGQAPQIGDPQPLGKKNASTKRFVVTTCFWVPTVDWKCLKSVWPQGKGDHFEHGWKVHTKRLQHLEIWHFQKHLLKKKTNLPEITKKNMTNTPANWSASISLNFTTNQLRNLKRISEVCTWKQPFSVHPLTFEQFKRIS